MRFSDSGGRIALGAMGAKGRRITAHLLEGHKLRCLIEDFTGFR
jgi:hypothetical protein